MKLLAKSFLGLIALGSAPLMAASLPDLSVGKPFPQIVLPRSNDAALESIAEHSGKKLMVHVFAGW